MGDKFDPRELATKLNAEVSQMFRIQKDLEANSMLDGDKYVKLENDVAAKMRADIEPVWNDPTKLRQLGAELRSEGIDVAQDRSNGLPIAVFFHPNQDDYVDTVGITTNPWGLRHALTGYNEPRIAIQGRNSYNTR